MTVLYLVGSYKDLGKHYGKCRGFVHSKRLAPGVYEFTGVINHVTQAR